MTPLPDPDDGPVLLVVDLSCWVWRFCSVMAAGRPAHETISWVRRVTGELGARLVVCADYPAATFRHELTRDLPEKQRYKAQRPPRDPEVGEQLRLAAWLVEDWLGVPLEQHQGFEGDDAVAAVVACRAPTERAVVLGLDKDLMQVVDSDYAVMWDGKEQVWGSAEVREKLGVPPRQVASYLALVGDAVDNIPGVPGVGPVGARRILGQHADLEAAIAAGAVTHTALARLSLQLATLRRDVPISDAARGC